MKKPVYENKTPIDFNAVYLCPMIIKGDKFAPQQDEITEIKIEPYEYGYMYKLIPLNEERYNIKYYYDNYMDWLFYTGYIKKKENS